MPSWSQKLSTLAPGRCQGWQSGQGRGVLFWFCFAWPNRSTWWFSLIHQRNTCGPSSHPLQLHPPKSRACELGAQTVRAPPRHLHKGFVRRSRHFETTLLLFRGAYSQRSAGKFPLGNRLAVINMTMQGRELQCYLVSPALACQASGKLQ